MSYFRKMRIFLENPTSEGNIGAVIRNIYAFDFGTLIIPRNAKLNINSASCCGTGDKIHIQKIDDATTFLKSCGFRKIGFVVQDTAIDVKSIISFEFKDNDLLIFGCEGSGLTKETIDLCDFLVTIPMFGHKSCLNLATSTGVAMYEVVRQRITSGCIKVPSIKLKANREEKLAKFMKSD